MNEHNKNRKRACWHLYPGTMGPASSRADYQGSDPGHEMGHALFNFVVLVGSEKSRLMMRDLA